MTAISYFTHVVYKSSVITFLWNFTISAVSCMSFGNIMKKIRPNRLSWGTPLVTLVHSEFLLLTVTYLSII